MAIFWPEFSHLFRMLGVRLTNLGVPSFQLVEAGLLQPEKTAENVFHLIFAAVVFVVVVLVSNFMNAQFLLPVSTWRDRFDIFANFSYFMLGQSGPLVFVQDGVVVSHLGEQDREGPGVALVHSNNAVVVGSKVYGPGFVFTWKPKQKVNKVMDLRQQVRTGRDVRAITRDGIEVSTDITVEFSISTAPELIYVTLEPTGQMPRKEDLRIVEFDPNGDMVLEVLEADLLPDELNEIFQTIRDIENGLIDQIPFVDLNEYGYQNLYHKDRVQACYDHQPLMPVTGEKVLWSELPIKIAIEEFRNAIVKYPYDDMFVTPEEGLPAAQAEEGTGGQTTASTRFLLAEYLEERRRIPMEVIRRDFARRVRNSGYIVYIPLIKPKKQKIEVKDRLQDLQQMTELPIRLNYPRPLRRCMISVTEVGFSDLQPTNPEVRQQTVENLIARWSSEAYKTEVGFSEQASMIRSRAKAQVQQDTVYALRDLLQSSDRAKAVMILRIFQALEDATADSNNKEMANMVKMLGELREWFSE